MNHSKEKGRAIKKMVHKIHKVNIYKKNKLSKE